jgi:tRNA(Phe) wybutosine-synthesizing methylase Tyw3
MSTSKRYLSAAIKRRILTDWERRKRTAPSRESKDVGGSGRVDPDVVPWCDLINRIPGICTIQSCAGHRSGKFMHSGHLWLRLSKKKSASFDRKAFELSSWNEIESVSRVYSSQGQEITVIAFAGNERGLFDQSMRLVHRFLELI